MFGPQKGADAEAVAELEHRLGALAEQYRERFDVDVLDVDGGGAAGGLAGGLAALGARLVPGSALVADLAGLGGALSGSSLALTGEGRVDATSLAGKVVGNVLAKAAELGVPVGLVAGDVEPGVLPAGIPHRSLVALAGSFEEAVRDAARLAADAAGQLALTI